FQCPADFISSPYKPCSGTSLKNLTNSKTEVWLIKAPANFNPESFAGTKIPLIGTETLKPKSSGGTQQVYNIFSTPKEQRDMCLLTSSGDSGKILCTPGFAGIINICETFGDCNANQAPKAIPASPPPRIPEGLKQRFQPFGSETPCGTGRKRCREDDPASSSASAKRLKTEPPGSPVLQEQGAIRKTKKKRKKEKRAEPEEMEADVDLAAAPEEPVLHEMTTERKKKKKTKKEKDQGGTEQSPWEKTEEESGMKEEEVEVKIEPLQSGWGDEEDVRRKKKKKKKNNLKLEN
ncbi:RPA34 polymerase, partial [Amia calva]|nr:RPA34 polymerase [Amia calva]